MFGFFESDDDEKQEPHPRLTMEDRFKLLYAENPAAFDRAIHGYLKFRFPGVDAPQAANPQAAYGYQVPHPYPVPQYLNPPHPFAHYGQYYR